MGRKKDDVHHPPLHIIHDELVRQRDSLARRADAMNGRATVLIGSAAIAGSLQASSLFGNGWLIIAVVATAAAAVFGILATAPRTGIDLDPAELRNKLYLMNEHDALMYLIDNKNHVHAQQENLLASRARWLRVGYVCLVISILAFVALVSKLQVTITF